LKNFKTSKDIQIRYKTQYPFILWISFFAAFLSIFLGIFVNMFGFHFTFYNLFYLTIVVLFLFVLFKLLQFDNVKFNLGMNSLFWYVLLITGPITLYYTNYIVYLTYLKNNLIPFIIAFFCISKIKENRDLLPLLRIICYATIFCSIFLIIEFVNKVTGFSDVLSNAISNYYIAIGSTSMIGLAKVNKDALTLIRPLGLDFSIASSSFISASGLILNLGLSNYIYKTRYMAFICSLILYTAVMCSLSRQIIFGTHICLLIAYYFYLRFNNLGAFNNRFRFMITALLKIIIISLAMLFILLPSQYITFLTPSTKDSTAMILMGDLARVPNILYQNFLNYPLQSLFGVGGYTPSHPGFVTNLESINELHFLLNIPYSIGIFGFLLFWSVIFKSLSWNWKAMKLETNVNYFGIYFSGFLIGILFLSCIIHYSPIGLMSSFIIALIPLTAALSRNQLLSNWVYNT